jgi:hypothetical protein
VALARIGPEALKAAGQLAVNNIKGRTRQGKDLSAGGKADSNADRSQPPLSRSWIEQRQRLAAFNQTHPAYSPKRSNLTLTGQLLDAVSFRVKNNRAEVFVAESTRRGYAYVPSRGPRKGQTVTAKAPTNAKLAEFLGEQGRFFLGLSPKEKKIISNRVRQLLRKALARVD